MELLLLSDDTFLVFLVFSLQRRLGSRAKLDVSNGVSGLIQLVLKAIMAFSLHPATLDASYVCFSSAESVF